MLFDALLTVTSYGFSHGGGWRWDGGEEIPLKEVGIGDTLGRWREGDGLEIGDLGD